MCYKRFCILLEKSRYFSWWFYPWQSLTLRHSRCWKPPSPYSEFALVFRTSLPFIIRDLLWVAPDLIWKPYLKTCIISILSNLDNISNKFDFRKWWESYTTNLKRKCKKHHAKIYPADNFQCQVSVPPLVNFSAPSLSFYGTPVY